jgi:hypothetical protein
MNTMMKRKMKMRMKLMNKTIKMKRITAIKFTLKETSNKNLLSSITSMKKKKLMINVSILMKTRMKTKTTLTKSKMMNRTTTPAQMDNSRMKTRTNNSIVTR